MGMLCAAYFDASGKQEGYPFLTVGGAASPIKKWIRFENQWSAALGDEGVSEFHATDFSASEGEYREWKGDKARRSAFIKRLVKIIKENVNKLFLVTVEMGAWRDVNREYCLEETFYSAYALAGFSVACQALQWAKRREANLPFKIFFENGDEGWNGLRQLCQRYGNFEPLRLPRKDGIPFQIGDFLAWKTRIAATNSISILKRLQRTDNLEGILDELKSVESILVRPVHNGIYSPNALQRTCKNFKVPQRSQSI